MLTELRKLLTRLEPGSIADASEVKRLLAQCWGDLSGWDETRMAAHKIARAEGFDWQAPKLSFIIERHGGIVVGSTRAEVQRWIVDVDQCSAECISAGARQLIPADRPLRTGPIVAEIVSQIASGVDDDRLSWFPDRKSVRVLIPKFITGKFKQTEEGRRKRFRVSLQKELAIAGWALTPNTRDVYARSVQVQRASA